MRERPYCESEKETRFLSPGSAIAILFENRRGRAIAWARQLISRNDRAYVRSWALLLPSQIYSRSWNSSIVSPASLTIPAIV